MPDHNGATGNEIADTCAREAARERTQDTASGRAIEPISLSFLRRRARETAGKQWRDRISGLSRGRWAFDLSRPSLRPKIRTVLWNTPKARRFWNRGGQEPYYNGRTPRSEVARRVKELGWDRIRGKCRIGPPLKQQRSCYHGTSRRMKQDKYI